MSLCDWATHGGYLRLLFCAVPFSNLRQRERPAVRPPQQPVRLLIPRNRLVPRVEAQRPPRAQGDVAEVTQPRALVPLLDLGVEALAVLDRVDEIAQVR